MSPGAAVVDCAPMLCRRAHAIAISGVYAEQLDGGREDEAGFALVVEVANSVVDDGCRPEKTILSAPCAQRTRHPGLPLVSTVELIELPHNHARLFQVHARTASPEASIELSYLQSGRGRWGWG